MVGGIYEAIDVVQDKDTYSFNYASADINRFEELLKRFGLKIESGSELERLALNVHDVLYKHMSPSTQNPTIDIREWLIEVMGMNHLIQRILKIQNHSEINQIIKHLKLLNDCTPLQTAPTLVTDQKSNKVFELLITCSVMQSTSNIQLDDPENARGDNPDILAYFGKTKWGIACKVAHSLKGKTIFDNIIKGIDQIEVSDADAGVVIVNLKNVINHQLYWTILNEDDWKNGAEPIFSCFSEYRDAVSKLLGEVASIEQIIIRDVGEEQIKVAFKNKKTVPGFMFYVHTAVGVEIDSKATPTSIGFLKLSAVGNLSKNENDVLKSINDGLQLAPPFECE